MNKTVSINSPLINDDTLTHNTKVTVTNDNKMVMEDLIGDKSIGDTAKHCTAIVINTNTWKAVCSLEHKQIEPNKAAFNDSDVDTITAETP
jgi:hypothetical protein